MAKYFLENNVKACAVYSGEGSEFSMERKEARSKTYESINIFMVKAYWQIGKIINEAQKENKNEVRNETKYRFYIKLTTCFLSWLINNESLLGKLLFFC